MLTRSPARKSVNLSLNKDLLAEAKELGINLSRIAEESIAQAVSAEKSRRWKEENSEAIREHNAWVEEHGLPLAQYRVF